MRNSFRTSLFAKALSASLLGPLLVATAAAIDFSSTPIAFDENFTGETISPTTAEVDLLGGGGMTAESFTGSAARFAIDAADSLSLASMVVDSVDHPILFESLGLRANHVGLTFGTDGQAHLVNLVSFTDADSLLLLGCDIDVTRSGGNFSIELVAYESNETTMMLTSSSLSLPASDAAAVGAGGSFVVDAHVDRDTDTLVCEFSPSGAGTPRPLPTP